MAAGLSLKDLLLQDLSRKHAESIAEMAGKNQSIFDELWELALSDDHPINWRAAWAMDAVWQKTPKLIIPFIPKMWSLLPSLKVDGVKRQFVKIIAEWPLPDNEEQLGILLGTCFDWLVATDEAIAVKVHCMQILYNISIRIPEIVPELKTTIEVAMLEGSPAIVSRGRHVLQRLQKQG